MAGKERKLVLTSVDELFSTEESRADAQREKVQEIPLSELHPFKDHPFRVVDDDHMKETAQSIKENGVLMPAIARPRAEGGYELIAGHRRKFASEKAGLTTMPVIVRDVDDDTATLMMVDSNIQRETLLPSERAFAYKMKLEAIKRQGSRSDLTLEQVVPKLPARERVAQEAGEKSGIQISRYIRLTELIPRLLNMVDERKIAFNPAVELSYLKPNEQDMLIDTMEREQATPSLSQAQRLKKFSQNGKLTPESMLAIMSEEKKTEVDKVSIPVKTIAQYCPKGYTPQQLTDYVVKVLERVWQQKQQKRREQVR